MLRLNGKRINISGLHFKQLVLVPRQLYSHMGNLSGEDEVVIITGYHARLQNGHLTKSWGLLGGSGT